MLLSTNIVERNVTSQLSFFDDYDRALTYDFGYKTDRSWYSRKYVLPSSAFRWFHLTRLEENFFRFRSIF